MHHARQHKAARKMLERFRGLAAALGAAVPGSPAPGSESTPAQLRESGDLNEASMALEAGG